MTPGGNINVLNSLHNIYLSLFDGLFYYTRKLKKGDFGLELILSILIMVKTNPTVIQTSLLLLFSFAVYYDLTILS